jgi:hypothetical protein
MSTKLVRGRQDCKVVAKAHRDIDLNHAVEEVPGVWQIWKGASMTHPRTGGGPGVNVSLWVAP